jgi:ParB family transcriptional regulator, chromosome partitioning protein
MSRSRLGRGLDMLLAKTGTGPDSTNEVVAIPLDAISPNPRQPRHGIDSADQDEIDLAASIDAHGVIQPVLVRPKGAGRYELIAGERRFRACERLGRRTVPAIVRDADDEALLSIAIIENLQRKDLNPIEKAEAIKHLIEDFDLTQEEAAKKVGKQRSSVANLLRLLDLEPAIRDAVSRGTITFGHARALLAVPSGRDRLALFDRILKEGLNVRKVESEAGRKSKRPRMKRRDSNIEELEDALRIRFGTKVTVESRGKRGKVVVHFGSHAEFDRLLELWGVERR